MKVLGKDMGAGRMILLVESLDDVWHVRQLVVPGDLAEALTERRDESRTDALRQERGEKRKVVLGVRVEKVEYHDFADMVRLTGIVETGAMGKGSYHTLNVEPGDRLTVYKERWARHELERVEEAVKASMTPSVLVLSMEEGDAVLAALRHFGVQKIAHMTGDTRGKQYREKHDVNDFYTEVLDELAARRAGGTPLVVVGPGFEKEHFLQFARDRKPVVVEGARVLGTGQAGMTGVYEALKSGAVAKAALATRVEEETMAVEALLEGIGTDGPVTYGPDHVRRALEAGAVERLLVTDDMVRSEGTTRLMEMCEEAGGRVLIVSTAHEGGLKLEPLGGLGAMLRYKFSD